nr:hypothetical protein HmN_000930600 [Hymenolepis microstoma]
MQQQCDVAIDKLAQFKVSISSSAHQSRRRGQATPDRWPGTRFAQERRALRISGGMVHSPSNYVFHSPPSYDTPLLPYVLSNSPPILLASSIHRHSPPTPIIKLKSFRRHQSHASHLWLIYHFFLSSTQRPHSK